MLNSRQLFGVALGVQDVEILLDPRDPRNRTIMLGIQAGIAVAWLARIRDHEDTKDRARAEFRDAVEIVRRGIRHLDEEIGGAWRLEDALPAIARQIGQ